MRTTQQQVQELLADRRAPESQRFLLEILSFVERRARYRWRARYQDLLSEGEVEEVMAEVSTELVLNGLHRFRGETPGELWAFVRTATDRTVARRAARRVTERAALEHETSDWVRMVGSVTPPPDHIGEYTLQVALCDRDQRWLVELLSAGSQVALSRAHGVSRAAVSQRLQRLQARIASLPRRDREAVQAWLRHQARQVIESSPLASPG